MQYPIINEQVANLTEVKRSINTDYKGTITQCLLYFSKGCSGIVDLRMLVNNSPTTPTDGYIALEGPSSHMFDLRVPVERGDVISAEAVNHDDTHPHEVSVFVTIIPA